MKANGAPEKIYIHSDNDIMGEVLGQKAEGDIEYVRTDAFIEKAVSFIRNCTSYDGLGYKAKCVNIEHFKKYMEL